MPGLLIQVRIVQVQMIQVQTNQVLSKLPNPFDVSFRRIEIGLADCQRQMAQSRACRPFSLGSVVLSSTSAWFMSADSSCASSKTTSGSMPDLSIVRPLGV